MRTPTLILFALFLTTAANADPAPTLYIIGDSTANSPVKGQQGWATPIASMFDLTKITVQNKARGGRSSRTYFAEGLWQQIVDQLKPGIR